MAFDPKTWYLGWLGDMRALPTPEIGLDMSEVRMGGVHQGLNGARTVDILGFRTQFDMDFKYLSEDEYAWLRAMHTRFVREPLYLINPLRKNLLSQQASTGYVHSVYDVGIQNVSSLTMDTVLDFPTGVPAGGTVVPRVISAPTTYCYLVMDGGVRFIPIFQNEPLTYSMYMRTTSGTASVDMYIQTMDKYGVATVGPGMVSTKTVTTSWQRFSMTHTPTTAGVAGARIGVQLVTAGTYNVCFAAPQVEYGSVVTPFQQGGGSLKVAIDQISSESPRFPLSNVSLSLVEV